MRQEETEDEEERTNGQHNQERVISKDPGPQDYWVIVTITESGSVATERLPLPVLPMRHSVGVCMGGKVYVWVSGNTHSLGRWGAWERCMLWELSLDTREWTDLTDRDIETWPCPTSVLDPPPLTCTPLMVQVSDRELLLLSVPEPEDLGCVPDTVQGWIYDTQTRVFKAIAPTDIPNHWDECDKWTCTAERVGSSVHVFGSEFGGDYTPVFHKELILPTNDNPQGHWIDHKCIEGTVGNHVQDIGGGLLLRFTEREVDCYDTVRCLWSRPLLDLDPDGNTCIDKDMVEGYATYTSCRIDAETVFLLCTTEDWWMLSRFDGKEIVKGFLLTVDQEALREHCTVTPTYTFGE
ncbi:hypothetical protein KIPB_003876 [Kipferlia bialata]|uniref:Uncharacterized protein n=1 Tax=Kipferlia bialata TaxID=797122 RepID=A0A9K3CT38_9EUKA|nr:hypothetical protein KIPB_003876 [Kipferlia bialata]|eukprot:g3876.t1